MNLNATQSIAVLLANSFAGKVYMTLAYRAPISFGQIPKSVLDSDKYKTDASAQLNEAEYTALLIAGIAFLDSKGSDVTTAATMAAAGSVIYLWGRSLLGFPFYVPGAFMRYGSMGLMLNELYKMW